MREIKILLTEEEFQSLVKGRVVRKESNGLISITLQDIGVVRMMEIIKETPNESETI